MTTVGVHREAACAAHVRAVETLRDGESLVRGWMMRVPDVFGGGFLVRVDGDRDAQRMTLTEIQSLAVPTRPAGNTDDVWFATLLEAAEALA